MAGHSTTGGAGPTPPTPPTPTLLHAPLNPGPVTLTWCEGLTVTQTARTDQKRGARSDIHIYGTPYQLSLLPPPMPTQPTHVLILLQMVEGSRRKGSTITPRYSRRQAVISDMD